MSIKIRNIEKSDIPGITTAFADSEWHVSEDFFEGLLAEQERGERVMLLAYADGSFAGYVTIEWKSNYPPFAAKGVPEINDLRVLGRYRRCGVATALIDEAERRTFERSPVAGIGVGMYADYGAAQRMYVLRGYVPDGKGLHYNNIPVMPGQDVCVDDELCLYFTKEREAMSQGRT